MANSSIILSNLDFDTQKNTLKQYLKSQDRFKDYDFDGSNISVLLDILTYNTNLNSFYLNMVASEMFLDSAQLRDSVVSHAKELNYVPASFRSAEATVTLSIDVATSLGKRSMVMPKGTTFTSKLGNRNFTFSTSENIVISDSTTNGDTMTFTSDVVTLYEGDYLLDSYIYSPNNTQRFIISNKSADISSISVTVIEDVGATIYQYFRANSLFDLDSESKSFFIQGAENESYEIIFGDGVIGRKPKDNSAINIEYRVCSGELPNGCSSFRADGNIDGSSTVRVTTVGKSAGGSVNETIESIRFNAPRHFNAQERAVTTEDYISLLKINFPEINAVTAYGGEEVSPPQYGKVYVAVDLKEVDSLPDSKKSQYYTFLKPRSPVSIDPVIIDPEYMYVYVESFVNYNVNLTSLSVDDLRTLVISKIVTYAQDYLNDFNKTLRYSKLIKSIDDSHNSVVSNETLVKAVKHITPQTNVYSTIDVSFDIPLETIIQDTTVNSYEDYHSVESSSFTYNGQDAYLEDDGAGGMRVIATNGGSHQTIAEVGTINYDTGIIRLNNFKVESYIGSHIKVYATTKSKDIFSKKNIILNISESDIKVNINQVRE